MNVRSYCGEYYLLSDAKITHYLKGTVMQIEKALINDWLDNVNSCTQNESPKINMDCR